MSAYISREELLKHQYRIDDSATLSTRDVVNVEDIEDATSADVRENIHGEWTEWKARNGRYKEIPICSNCNTGFPIFAKDYNFCPNCGADMRGDKNDN